MDLLWTCYGLAMDWHPGQTVQDLGFYGSLNALSATV